MLSWWRSTFDECLCDQSLLLGTVKMYVFWVCPLRLWCKTVWLMLNVCSNGVTVCCSALDSMSRTDLLLKCLSTSVVCFKTTFTGVEHVTRRLVLGSVMVPFGCIFHNAVCIWNAAFSHRLQTTSSLSCCLFLTIASSIVSKKKNMLKIEKFHTLVTPYAIHL